LDHPMDYKPISAFYARKKMAKMCYARTGWLARNTFGRFFRA
jgi:hypothetical protein